MGKKIRKIAQSAGLIATVVDKLTSTSTSDALSANQGRILDEKIASNKNEANTKINKNTTDIASNKAAIDEINTHNILDLEYEIVSEW